MLKTFFEIGTDPSLFDGLEISKKTVLCQQHMGKYPIIVLIDEYDVPLDKAYQDGFYAEMVRLMRSLFSQVFKTNTNIYFAVITGCLRIAKESIFTGLNNFKVRTISDVYFAEYFGFMDNKVRESVLFATGYLTDAGKPENGIHKLVIPNREVLEIYERRIRSWFKVKVISDTTRWKKFCEADYL